MKSLLSKFLKTILPLGIGIYLLWYFFRQMDDSQLQQFYKVIYSADYWWILLSLGLSIIAFVIRAERWKLALEPLGYQTKLKNRYHSLMIGYIMNLTIPRAGEASRSAMLYRSEKVPFSKSFGTIISERVVDLCFLGGITLFTYFLNTQNFSRLFEDIQKTFGTSEKSNFQLYIYLFLALIAAAFILLFLFVPAFKSGIYNFIKGLFSGVFSIFKMKRAGLYLFYSSLIWLLYVIYFAICFYSIEATSHFPLSGIMLAFIAGSLGITFTNGGIGAFPLLVGIVISIAGSEIENAKAVGNALGMIIWGSQTLLIIILGVISLLLLPKSYGKESSEQAAGQDS